MHLPNASEFLTDLAFSASDGACHNSDVVDQFLTTVSFDDQHSYEGDSDFGTLTRLDLDDELRVTLVILALIAQEETSTHLRGDWSPAPFDYYRDNDVMLGEGSTYKWWSDWYATTEADAETTQAAFTEAYSRYLGCEDCNMPGDECICDSEPEPETCAIHEGRPHKTGDFACEVLSGELLTQQDDE